jgi:glycosyltransferase involved in cell wall biosynthesis
MALITIGIPVYNEERFLAKTIESAINQQFQDLQIIITDNCSTDRSYEIAQHYAQKDSRITVVQHPENIGALHNFICSLQMTDSKYFVWLGAHDIFTDNYLQEAIDFLETHDEVLMAYPRCQLIGKDDELLELYDPNDYIDTGNLQAVERILTVVYKLSCCSCFHGVFRTAILRSLPFESVIATDHILLIMLASYGHIRMMDFLGLKRRLFRKETEPEARQRYVEYGLYHSQDCAPRAISILKIIEHIWKHPNLSIADKWRISLRIGDDVAQRYCVEWTDLLYEAYKVNLPSSPNDSETIIPGILEAIIMDKLFPSESSSGKIIDYLKLEIDNSSVNFLEKIAPLVEDKNLRFLQIELLSGLVNDAQICSVFDYLRSRKYECYGVDGGSWELTTHPRLPYRSYIAIPSLTSQVRGIILSMFVKITDGKSMMKDMNSAFQKQLDIAENLKANNARLKDQFQKINAQLESQSRKIDALRKKLTANRKKKEELRLKIRNLRKNVSLLSSDAECKEKVNKKRESKLKKLFANLTSKK